MGIIQAIGTAVPAYRHEQMKILQFMQRVYALNEQDKRKLSFLYHQSGIAYRYSVLPDYSRPAGEWKFYPNSENLEPVPSLEQRMHFFNRYAPSLSVDAIRNCMDGKIRAEELTHLITVSCTGLSAPGLDLQVLELLDLPKTISRTSVNFMGCYAAIHALRIADSICRSDTRARVMIVCTELCTLHFQREPTTDNMTSSLLFGDGSAALLMTGDPAAKGLRLDSFYAEVVQKGKKDMAWELSSSGFQMTLSSYIPELIETDLSAITKNALDAMKLQPSAIQHWCIHPGGRRILEATAKSLNLSKDALQKSYATLQEYGNMSSATILFVLKNILHQINRSVQPGERVFGAAFGPGLTIETFTASAT